MTYFIEMRKRLLHFGDVADFGWMLMLMFQRLFPLCFGGFSLHVPGAEAGKVASGSMQVQLQIFGE